MLASSAMAASLRFVSCAFWSTFWFAFSAANSLWPTWPALELCWRLASESGNATAAKTGPFL